MVLIDKEVLDGLELTAFADMALGELVQLVADYQRDGSATIDIHDDRLMEVKSRRFSDISSIALEHDLPRSYMTVEECEAMAQAVFAGGRPIRSEEQPGTPAPNAITKLDPGAGDLEVEVGLP